MLPYDDDNDDNDDDCYCLPRLVDIVAYIVDKMLSEIGMYQTVKVWHQL